MARVTAWPAMHSQRIRIRERSRCPRRGGRIASPCLAAATALPRRPLTAIASPIAAMAAPTPIPTLERPMIAQLRPIALCLVAAALALGIASCAQKDAVGGPFQLVDQDGRKVDQSILKGKWTAVFFGYTYCPDVCPATLQTLGSAQERLGPK